METLPENLVALMYSPKHSSYPEVTNKQVPGLKVDIEKMEWLYVHPESGARYHQTNKIGSPNYFMKDTSCGVIGVYDSTDPRQLTSMVRNWHENIEDKHRNWNDVD